MKYTITNRGLGTRKIDDDDDNDNRIPSVISTLLKNLKIFIKIFIKWNQVVATDNNQNLPNFDTIQSVETISFCTIWKIDQCMFDMLLIAHCVGCSDNAGIFMNFVRIGSFLNLVLEKGKVF